MDLDDLLKKSNSGKLLSGGYGRSRKSTFEKSLEFYKKPDRSSKLPPVGSPYRTLYNMQRSIQSGQSRLAAAGIERDYDKPHKGFVEQIFDEIDQLSGARGVRELVSSLLDGSFDKLSKSEKAEVLASSVGAAGILAGLALSSISTGGVGGAAFLAGLALNATLDAKEEIFGSTILGDDNYRDIFGVKREDKDKKDAFSYVVTKSLFGEEAARNKWINYPVGFVASMLTDPLTYVTAKTPPATSAKIFDVFSAISSKGFSKSTLKTMFNIDPDEFLRISAQAVEDGHITSYDFLNAKKVIETSDDIDYIKHVGSLDDIPQGIPYSVVKNVLGDEAMESGTKNLLGAIRRYVGDPGGIRFDPIGIPFVPRKWQPWLGWIESKSKGSIGSYRLGDLRTSVSSSIRRALRNNSFGSWLSKTFRFGKLGVYYDMASNMFDEYLLSLAKQRASQLYSAGLSSSVKAAADIAEKTGTEDVDILAGLMTSRFLGPRGERELAVWAKEAGLSDDQVKMISEFQSASDRAGFISTRLSELSKATGIDITGELLTGPRTRPPFIVLPNGGRITDPEKIDEIIDDMANLYAELADVNEFLIRNEDEFFNLVSGYREWFMRNILKLDDDIINRVLEAHELYRKNMSELLLNENELGVRDLIPWSSDARKSYGYVYGTKMVDREARDIDRKLAVLNKYASKFGITDEELELFEHNLRVSKGESPVKVKKKPSLKVLTEQYSPAERKLYTDPVDRIKAGIDTEFALSKIALRRNERHFEKMSTMEVGRILAEISARSIRYFDDVISTEASNASFREAIDGLDFNIRQYTSGEAAAKKMAELSPDITPKDVAAASINGASTIVKRVWGILSKYPGSAAVILKYLRGAFGDDISKQNPVIRLLYQTLSFLSDTISSSIARKTVDVDGYLDDMIRDVRAVINGDDTFAGTKLITGEDGVPAIVISILEMINGISDEGAELVSRIYKEFEPKDLDGLLGGVRRVVGKSPISPELRALNFADWIDLASRGDRSALESLIDWTKAAGRKQLYRAAKSLFHGREFALKGRFSDNAISLLKSVAFFGDRRSDSEFDLIRSLAHYIKEDLKITSSSDAMSYADELIDALTINSTRRSRLKSMFFAEWANIHGELISPDSPILWDFVEAIPEGKKFSSSYIRAELSRSGGVLHLSSKFGTDFVVRIKSVKIGGRKFIVASLDLVSGPESRVTSEIPIVAREVLEDNKNTIMDEVTNLIGRVIRSLRTQSKFRGARSLTGAIDEILMNFEGWDSIASYRHYIRINDNIASALENIPVYGGKGSMTALDVHNMVIMKTRNPTVINMRSFRTPSDIKFSEAFEMVWRDITAGASEHQEIINEKAHRFLSDLYRKMDVIENIGNSGYDYLNNGGPDKFWSDVNEELIRLGVQPLDENDVVVATKILSPDTWRNVGFSSADIELPSLVEFRPVIGGPGMKAADILKEARRKYKAAYGKSVPESDLEILKSMAKFVEEGEVTKSKTGEPVSPSSLRKYRTMLRQFMAFLVNRGAPDAPIHKMTSVKASEVLGDGSVYDNIQKVLKSKSVPILERPGVYIISDVETGEIVYIGSSDNVARRLSEHVAGRSHIAEFINGAYKGSGEPKLAIRVIYTENVKSALASESELIKLLGPSINKVEGVSTLSNVDLGKAKFFIDVGDEVSSISDALRPENIGRLVEEYILSMYGGRWTDSKTNELVVLSKLLSRIAEGMASSGVEAAEKSSKSIKRLAATFGKMANVAQKTFGSKTRGVTERFNNVYDIIGSVFSDMMYKPPAQAPMITNDMIVSAYRQLKTMASGSGGKAIVARESLKALMLAHSSGPRISEVLDITCGDVARAIIDFRSSRSEVATIMVVGKGAKARRISISPWYVDDIERMLLNMFPGKTLEDISKISDPFISIPAMRRGKPVIDKATGSTKMLSKDTARQKITAMLGSFFGENFQFRSFRVQAATSAQRITGSVNAAREVLGHASDSRATYRYLSDTFAEGASRSVSDAASVLESFSTYAKRQPSSIDFTDEIARRFAERISSGGDIFEVNRSSIDQEIAKAHDKYKNMSEEALISSADADVAGVFEEIQRRLRVSIDEVSEYAKELEDVYGSEFVNVPIPGYTFLDFKLGDVRYRYEVPIDAYNHIYSLFNSIFEIDDAVKQFLKVVDTATNAWKRVATILRVPFHSRNKITNSLLMMLRGAFSFKHYMMSHGLMFGTIDNVVVGGKSYTRDEIMDLAAAHRGIVGTFESAQFSGMRPEEIYVGTDIKKYMRSGRGYNPLNPKSKTSRLFQYIGTNVVEDPDRFAVFLYGLDLGFSPQAAGAWADSVLYNYSSMNFSYLETQFLRRIFPFYGWMKNNTPNILSAMIEEPRTFQAMYRASYGSFDTQEQDRSLLSKVMTKNSPWFVLPIRDRGGNYFIVNIPVPTQDIDRIFEGSGMLATMNPMLKAFIEYPTGYDLFYEGPIERTPGYKTRLPGAIYIIDRALSNKISGPAWERIKEATGIVEVYDPFNDVVYLKGDAKWNKFMRDLFPILSNVSRIGPEPGKTGEKYMSGLLSELTGLKVQPMDVEDLYRFRTYERFEQVQKDIAKAKNALILPSAAEAKRLKDLRELLNEQHETNRRKR